MIKINSILLLVAMLISGVTCAGEKVQLEPIKRVAVISALETRFHNNYDGGFLGQHKTYSYDCDKVEQLNNAIERSLGANLEKKLSLELVDARELRDDIQRKAFHFDADLMKQYRVEFQSFADQNHVDAFVILRPMRRTPPGQAAVGGNSGGALASVLVQTMIDDLYSGVDLNIRKKNARVFTYAVIYDMRQTRGAGNKKKPKASGGGLMSSSWMLETKFSKDTFKNEKRPPEQERERAVEMMIDDVDNMILEMSGSVEKSIKKKNSPKK